MCDFAGDFISRPFSLTIYVFGFEYWNRFGFGLPDFIPGLWWLYFSISPSVFTSDKLISNNLRWILESMHGIQLIPFSGFLLRYQRINVISQEMYSSKWYHTILWSIFRRLPAQFPCVTFSIQFSLHYIIATRWIFPPIKLNNWILGSHQYGSTDCYEKDIEKGRTQKPIS